MALSPLRTPFIGGKLDNNGNGIFSGGLRSSHWASVTLAGRAQGTPSWDIMVGTDPALAGGPGGALTVGPLLVQPQEEVTIKVTGGVALTPVYGTFWGVQADQDSDLTSFIGAPTISALATAISPVGGSVQLIATQDVGSGSPSPIILPQTGFTDLQIFVEYNGSSDGAAIQIWFNSDGLAHYGYELQAAAGATRTDTSLTGQTSMRIGSVGTGANGVNSAVAWVHNYASSTRPKTVDAIAGRLGATSIWESEFIHGWWNQTTPVTDLTIFLSTGLFVAPSTVRIYGWP